MCVVRALTLALSLVVCSLFAFISGARANCDRHQRRGRLHGRARLRVRQLRIGAAGLGAAIGHDPEKSLPADLLDPGVASGFPKRSCPTT
jgi:hypothetical protein